MKNILFAILLLLACSTAIYAQETDTKKDKKAELNVVINEGENPDLYIDGIKYDAAILELLDPDKIATINVTKGEGKDKIIVISKKNGTTKFSTDQFEGDVEFKIKKGRGKKGGNEPVIIIDGEVVKKGTLDKLDPNTIKTIDVMKGDEAVEKYNAPNGVIIVTTKTKKN